MKAAVYNTYGSPDVIGIKDIPKPIPGDNDVLVRVHAVSINAWDWDMLTGKPLEYRVFSGLLQPRNKKLHGATSPGASKRWDAM